jgi:uncharacterized membrane protein YtjA (UPF0391 family)
MLTQAVIFLVLAGVAGGVSFTRVSGQAAVVARVQSVLFLFLAVLIGLYGFVYGS